MLRPHDFHLIFYMTAKHFQMVAAQGTGNAPASVHSHDSALRRQTPHLFVGHVPKAVKHFSAVRMGGNERSFGNFTQVLESIVV